MFKITVIVPIYNVEKYIGKCLDSLIKQSFSDFEVWCIDDGSLDNSKDIVKEYQKKDKRIKLICKENGGYGSVIEYALKNIKSKYFLICDSDDWLSVDCLEKLFNTVKKDDIDVVIADRYEVYNNCDKYVYKSNLNHSLYKMIPRVKYIQEDLQKFAFYMVSPHAKLYKTSIVKRLKFPRKVNYSDFLLYMYALDKAKSVIYIDIPLAYYFIDRPNNSMTSRNIKDYLIVWKNVFNNINHNSSYLMYRLFIQLKFILRENSLTIEKKENMSEICNCFNLLKDYKKVILKVVRKKSDKFLIYLFFNRFLLNIVSRVYMKMYYIYYKYIKKKVM